MPAQTHWSVPRKQLPIVKKLRASQLRCTLGYHHNDITVLIIDKPNNEIMLDSLEEGQILEDDPYLSDSMLKELGRFGMEGLG